MNKPITILSIDDDNEILYALQAIFDSQGWKSVIASDVENGLKAFWQFKPDIILMDYHLPRINGIEGVHILRQFSNTVPIIVFTIDENQEVADRFLEEGASDFALKPIKALDLISRINLHIQLMEHQPNRINKIVYNHRNNENMDLDNHLAKGISYITLELIKHNLSNENFLNAEVVVKATGLAHQTVYRYLQYMELEKTVEVHITYGKVGRPKNSYRLIF